MHRTLTDQDREDALSPSYVDSRNVGFMDAVRAGFFNSTTGELYHEFKITADDVVADVGTGAGGAALFAAQQGAAVLFSDISPDCVKRIEQAMSRTSARSWQGFVSDSLPLPFADHAATRVVAMEMLEHVEDPEGVMRELARISAPGALLLLSVPDSRSEQAQQGIAPPFYFNRPNHIHCFDRSTLDVLVTSAGFDIIRHDTYSFFWAMWIMIYWTWAKSADVTHTDIAHDIVHPPYPKILNDWARLWHDILLLPEGDILRARLDAIFPKSQIIVAQKL